MFPRRWFKTSVILALLVLILTFQGVQSGNLALALQGQWVSGSGTPASEKWALTFTTGEPFDPVPMQGERYRLESGIPIQASCRGSVLFLPLVGR